MIVGCILLACMQRLTVKISTLKRMRKDQRGLLSYREDEESDGVARQKPYRLGTTLSIYHSSGILGSGNASRKPGLVLASTFLLPYFRSNKKVIALIEQSSHTPKYVSPISLPHFSFLPSHPQDIFIVNTAH